MSCHAILRACLHGVGDPGLVGLVSFFFKQKTAYEIVLGDWSSDVCSSDLLSDEYDD